jgi:ethanolamine utilization cobalamin adenosyltransferase
VIVTEQALRRQLPRPRSGARVHVAPGATLSPAAADFVRQWSLELVADGAPGPAGAPDDGAAPPGSQASGRPAWDRPATFPVSTTEPRCTACGGVVADKPDALTQLDACHLAPKTHPRIRLRAALDELQAWTLLAAQLAATEGRARLADALDSVAAYCRELLAAEYAERVAAPLVLEGTSETEIHADTHDPAGRLGTPHLTPGPTDPPVLLWLNLLRCRVRAAEVLALEAFGSPHVPGASVAHGLNRLSSAVYWLALREVTGWGEPA